MLEILNKIVSCWSVLVTVCGTIFYKLLPFMKTRIIKNRYGNDESTMYLVGYELIGAVFIHLIIVVEVLISGRNSLNELTWNEYAMFWGIPTIAYLIGIKIIVQVWKKEGKKKYIKNILYGGLIHFFISWQILTMMVNINNTWMDCYFYLVVIGIAVIQIITNLEIKKTKNIKYLIYTDENDIYVTRFEPIKRDKYYHIRMMDDKRRIQIPENRIKRIEYSIEELGN